VLIHAKRTAEAIPVLERIYSENPDTVRYGLRLASCYQALNKKTELRKVVESLREKDQTHLPQLDLMEGTLLLAENKPRKALEFLNKAENFVSHLPYLHIQLGIVYYKIHRWQDAERAYLKALAIDENNAIAFHGLGLCYLRQKKYEQAAESFLNAIGLMYYFSEAHYHLGEALYYLENHENAAEAFHVAITLSPGYKKAHQWLIKIYEDHLDQPEKANASRAFIKEKIRGTIYIVSGLPRSGTSMMMQMLEAGGMKILTDNLRQNDANNPKGYLEFEKIKNLGKDNSWLFEAEGKTIKVIAQLLQFLPDLYNYKIIFMNREMNEVLISQQKMLGKDVSVFPMGLSEVFHKQLSRSEAWMRAQPNMDVMFVNYADIIADPQEQAENLEAFLGQDLDISAMTKAVDKNLYRNKTSA
jgi:tetratricopeptide (TPR) repeat protein